ncbi:MAG: mechanosensitive ion channel [Elusimicrobia bacterium]|nr:mechanosensitive ion channel [Elusimicrobiota bacterium]
MHEMMRALLRDSANLMLSAGALAGALALALIANSALFHILKRLARAKNPGWDAADDSLIRHGRRPARYILALAALLLSANFIPLPPKDVHALVHVLGLALIAAAGWGLVAAVDVFCDWTMSRYNLNSKDDLTARKVETQVHVLRRVASVIIVIVTGSIMFMTVPGIRAVGESVLASAGLAGLVLGMAAKPTLSNLIAGIQIALTQPIRIGDAVFIYDEWGWIEEIGTTYVVVRVWDLRRVVVPLSYIIENPFQNWTKTTANLLGYVYLYVDYTVPVDEIRAELTRLLKASDKWLGQVNVLQVTNATDRTVELRALMDAPDSGAAWDLRCYVREGLIKFIQARYPQCLPKARAELAGLPIGRSL